MKPDILRIFLECLGKRIRSRIGRHKDTTTVSAITEIFSGLALNSCKVFSALWTEKVICKVDFFTPFSFWQGFLWELLRSGGCSSCFTYSLRSSLSCQNVTNLLVLSVILLRILEEHVVVVISSRLLHEHLGSSFSLFGPLVDHGPITLVRSTVLQEYWTKWEEGLGSLALSTGIFLGFFENSFVVILFRLDQSILECLRELIKTMCTSCHVGQRNLTVLCQDTDLLAHISGQSRSIVPQHGVTD